MEAISVPWMVTKSFPLAVDGRLPVRQNDLGDRPTWRKAVLDMSRLLGYKAGGNGTNGRG